MREIREKLGNEERGSFALKLGLPKTTLANYEAGTTEPTVSVLEAYKNVFGINPNWIISGEGEMFADAIAAPASIRVVDPVLFGKLTSKIDDLFEGLGQETTKADVAEIAAEIYNKLLADDTDFSEPDILNAAIALEIAKLKSRIPKGSNSPHTAVA